MTFLELVQDLWRESGSTGTTQPTTIIGATGEIDRLVHWTNKAWRDIQSMHTDWGWMRASASFTTVDGTAIYTLGTGAGTVGVAAASFDRWVKKTGRTYVTAVGTNSENFLPDMDYESWRNLYQFGANRNAKSRPIQCAISPDKSICLGPVPLAGYTVLMDYFRAPTSLDTASDDATPDMPAKYHEAIVWRALMLYGKYESAPEAYDNGKEEWAKWEKRLEASYLPPMEFAGALA